MNKPPALRESEAQPQLFPGQAGEAQPWQMGGKFIFYMTQVNIRVESKDSCFWKYQSFIPTSPAGPCSPTSAPHKLLAQPVLQEHFEPLLHPILLPWSF